MVFLRVRLVVMSAVLLLVQDASAFYLPGLAPVSFCEKPKDAARECQVSRCGLLKCLGLNIVTKLN